MAWLDIMFQRHGVHTNEWPVEMTAAAERFERLLDAEAWLDAAMMLVPEGWLIGLMFDSETETAEAGVSETRQAHVSASVANTPAEALLEAILAARKNHD